MSEALVYKKELLKYGIQLVFKIRVKLKIQEFNKLLSTINFLNDFSNTNIIHWINRVQALNQFKKFNQAENRFAIVSHKLNLKQVPLFDASDFVYIRFIITKFIDNVKIQCVSLIKIYFYPNRKNVVINYPSKDS